MAWANGAGGSHVRSRRGAVTLHDRLAGRCGIGVRGASPNRHRRATYARLAVITRPVELAMRYRLRTLMIVLAPY